MIILDTNVLSALMRAPQDPEVVRWLDQQPGLSLWTTSITILEIRLGIEILSTGRRRSQLADAFERAVNEVLQRRIAVFDAESAYAASALLGERQKKGRVVELRDAMIAGIALAHRATIATRNQRHFDDLATLVVNPWAGSSSSA